MHYFISMNYVGMAQVQKKGFIETTIQSYQNLYIEESIERGRNAQQRLKRITQTDNKYYKMVILIVTVLFLFFITPLFVTGLFTKGMHVREQFLIWMTVVIIGILMIAQKYMF